MKRVDRIREMENCLDVSAEALGKLSSAAEAYEAALPFMKKLSAYYGSAQWRRDLEADEAGRLPKELKRGVLSEDAVWDLLSENRELCERLAALIEENARL